MATTITSHRGYFQRIGDSFRGLGFGLVLFLAAFRLLFWNEGVAKRNADALSEIGASVVSVDCETVNPLNEGKVIHFRGRAVAPDCVLRDDCFGVEQTNVLALVRNAQMYQWTENEHSDTKTNLGGSEDTVTTYTYSKGWFSDLVSSDGFVEQEDPKTKEPRVNPPEWAVAPARQYATGVTVGAFRVPDDRVPSIGTEVPVPLPAVTNALPAGAKAGLVRTDWGLYFSWGATNVPAAPKVGDEKLTLTMVRPTDVSFIAVQSGDTIVPYVAKDGTTTKFLQSDGLRSPEEMVASAKKANTTFRFILRILGFFLMRFGLRTLLKPLGVLADVLPFLGSIVRFLTGAVASVVCAALTLITIAIAWIVVRPVIGISLLAAAAALVILCVAMKKKASSADGTAKGTDA